MAATYSDRFTDSESDSQTDSYDEVKHESNPRNGPLQRAGTVFILSWRYTYGTNREAALGCLGSLRTALDALCSDYIFQLEDSTKGRSDTELAAEGIRRNIHYQGWAKLAQRARPTAIGARLGTQFPGIQVDAASTAGINALKAYAMKEDTRIAGPWGKKPIYMGADLPTTWRKWQQELLDMLNGKPDDRSCYWYYDPVGQFGKSKIAKFLGWKKNALYLSWADTKDAIHNVSKNMGKPIYLFDIPRTKPKLMACDDMYSSIEQIKNGVVANTKYEASTQYMDPPWVIVFSNQLPKLEAMSNDRWKIFILEGNPETCSAKPYTGESTDPKPTIKKPRYA